VKQIDGELMQRSFQELLLTLLAAVLFANQASLGQIGKEITNL